MFGRFLTWLILGVLAKCFPKRYRLVPRIQDGAPLLHQFKLTKWAYLQSFQNPEAPDLFHCHRWEKMYSVVLSGEFREERYPGGCWKVHRAPSFYSMDRSTIHRIEYVTSNTWTLFFMFGNQEVPGYSAWGYFARPAYIDYAPANVAIPAERRVPPL